MSKIETWASNLEKFSLLAIVLMAFFISVSTSLMTIFFFLGSLSLWLAGNWRAKLTTIINNPISYWVLFLLLMVSVGSIYSTGSYLDIGHTLLRYSKFLFLLLLLPLFNKNQNKNIVLNAFIIGAVFMLLMCLLKIMGLPINFYSLDPACAFHDHIQTSWEVALTIFILSHRLLEPLTIKLRLLIILIIGLASYYLFFLNSGRSGLLLFGILFLIFCMQRFSWRYTLFAFLFFILLVSFIFHFSSNFKNLTEQALEHTKASLTHKPHQPATSEGLRLSFWKHTLKIIEKNPLKGTGTGSFNKEYKQFSGYAPLTTNPHNEYLLFGVQFGLIGIIYLIAFYSYLMKLTFKIENQYKFIIQGILTTYIIGCLFNSWLYDAVNGYSFVVFIALFYANLKFHPSFRTKKLIHNLNYA